MPRKRTGRTQTARGSKQPPTCPGESVPSAPTPTAEPDPLTAAIAAVEQLAAGGNLRAVKYLSDGTLARLRRQLDAEQLAPHPADRLVGEVRTPCPGCGHMLCVRYDTWQGWAALTITDLPSAFTDDAKTTETRL